MPITQLRGTQVLAGSIQRSDLDTTTAGEAIIRKVLAGTNVTISSTGVDAGTGDVTINVPSVPASPAGNTKEVQYNNAGTTAGAANVEIDSGDLVLLNSTAPTTPGANSTKVSSVLDFVNPELLMLYPDTTNESVFASPVEQQAVMFYCPSGTTVGTGFGFGGSWATSGTVSHPALTSTTRATTMPRTRWANVVTTTNQALGIIGNAPGKFWRGNAANRGGFVFKVRFVIELIPAATIRLFYGLCGASPIATDTPTGDFVGLWHDTTDSITTLNIITRDNVTTTKAPITVPTLAAGNSYEFVMYSAPNAAEVFYKLTNFATGVELANGSITATLPRNTIFMLPCAQMSNGTANIVATTVGHSVGIIYVKALSY
jgi:hypothetical protein